MTQVVGADVRAAGALDPGLAAVVEADLAGGASNPGPALSFKP